MYRHGRTAAIAASAALMLALSACGGNAGTAGGGTDRNAAELVLGAGVEPQSFDPAQSREAQFVQYFQPVFDTLVRRMPNGEPGGMLATSWEYTKGNTRLTLKLRDDVTFTDGTKFDAQAAKANIDRFRKAGGPLAGSLASVKSAEAADATTLVLDLSAPDPSLVYNLGGPGGYMQSPKQFDAPDIDTQPVGSGPYVLDRSKSTPGSKYVYTANKDYWNPKLRQFDQIVIKPMADENARLNALRSGQIEGMIATAKTIKQAQSAKLKVNFVSGDWQGLTLFDRDGKRVKALGDVRVRQAINYAIDKKAILKNVVLGHGETTSQVFNPSSEAYVKDLDERYGYDVAKAKSLLADAGYADGFTLKMPSSSDMDPAIAPVVRDQLAAVGIEVKWVDVPSAQYQPEQQSGKYAAAFTAFGQPPVAWTSLSQMVTAKSPWNVLKTSDATVDDLLKKITAAPEGKRDKAYQELNTHLVEEAWFSPWYRIQQPYYTGGGVTVQPQTGQAVPSVYNFAPAK